MQNLSEAKKCVDVLADVGSALEKVVAEKGGLLAKVAHLVPLSGDVLLVAGIDYAAAKAEFSSLSDEDKSALVAEFKVKFDLADDALEAKIEEGLDLSLAAEQLVAKVIAFSKSLKAAAPAAPIA